MKKILYVDSYHGDYAWSAGITNGIWKGLKGRKDVELKIFRMDTKRKTSEEFKTAAALQAKHTIESWKPDLVIVSDDNACKYLLARFYKDSPLPFVFCGINWSVKEYGLPYENATGMIEQTLVKPLLNMLKEYSRGSRVAFLAPDVYSQHKEATQWKELLGLEFHEEYVSTMDEWKQAFVELQKTHDIIMVRNLSGLSDGDQEEAREWIELNSSVPTGGTLGSTAGLSLVSLAKDPEEQGEWAAQTALRILAGTPPKDIPVASNERFKIYLNMKLARKLNIKFPMELIERAHLVTAGRSKVFFVNSYHKGYRWSDDIEAGLLRALSIEENPDGSYDTTNSGVELKTFRMDTKRNPHETFGKQAALAAKTAIDAFQPDLIIASDDNAAKYLIAEYYKNVHIPVVFCGLNWDASAYGFPCSNVTGMIEVSPYQETVEMLRHFAKGDRIGVIGADNLSNRKQIPYLVEILEMKPEDIHLVSNFDQWKHEYAILQNEVDMLLWLNPIGISGWNQKEAKEAILESTKIPTGTASDNNVQYALVGHVKIAEEQGWWAGKTALRVLAGTSPNEIPVAHNQQTRLYLNMELADHLGIKFPMEVLERATFVGDH